MAKAIAYSTVAVATRPLTDYLKRLRLAKKASASRKSQRALTEQRVGEAEQLLADIITGADIIGHGVDPGSYPAAYLLLPLHRGAFDDLATFGAEREDFESSHDREPDSNDEPSHGDDAPESLIAAISVRNRRTRAGRIERSLMLRDSDTNHVQSRNASVAELCDC
jgi:hypothetical protein